MENGLSETVVTEEKMLARRTYIQFDKNQLVNLEYSLSKELLRTNKRGAYASSTIINCNTRKYHGLLVVPQPQIDNDNHVLLSSVDETVIQNNSEFHLAIHKFPGGIYHPKGHKYVKDFSADPVPHWIYAVGGVELKKEIIFLSDTDCVMLRYTLEETPSPARLRLMPFLAFRNYHALSKANTYANKKYTEVPNGIRLRLYSGYMDLIMQTSKAAEYTSNPDWYYNFEYPREQERGYEYQEDLFTPGFFEFEMKKSEQVVFAAGLSELNPRSLKAMFQKEVKTRIPRSSFENCLLNSAKQFVVQRDKKTEVVAGYHWFGRWGRDTFIALPGLTLETNKPELCKAALTTMTSQLKNGLFPNMGCSYNSADAPLWFFWTLQQYSEFTGMEVRVWITFGSKMRAILDAYRRGTDYNIRMNDNGLIAAGYQGVALTWMDAVVDGKPVTPRTGMPVEINALWYNAVCFSLKLAKLAEDEKFVKQWDDLPEMIADSFVNTFWDEHRAYLADVVNEDGKDWSVRPNQIFAASLPYSPLDETIRSAVVEKVKSELLTPRGLRTLSPKDPNYKGTYFGDQKTRDQAYHQGTVWPWLLGHFSEAYLKLYGKNGVTFIKQLYDGFGPTMMEHGISTVSEIFDGDPPHRPEGAISQAWSVAELIRINSLMKKYGKMKK
ncbi:MAG TPA: amylo-alpha-1,6-glucosidase [Chitinophagales bacterium]|nr:amylo-alpha-1,6-glucosidase [Chitinophagales bacterium]